MLLQAQNLKFLKTSNFDSNLLIPHLKYKSRIFWILVNLGQIRARFGPNLANFEMLKSISGHYIFRLQEFEGWAKKVHGRNSYRRKSQISLDNHKFEVDAAIEVVKHFLGSF